MVADAARTGGNPHLRRARKALGLRSVSSPAWVEVCVCVCVCVRGALRCKFHVALPQPPHQVSWKKYQVNPSPFFVKDVKNMPHEQKIKWIRDEVDADAPLAEFAVV